MKRRGYKILLNVLVLVLGIGFVVYVVLSVNRDESSYNGQADPEAPEEAFHSPYQATSSFELPDDIIRFELSGDTLLIAAGASIYRYTAHGTLLASFPAGPDVRDIRVGQDEIFVLYPTEIKVYAADGLLIRQWEACSELSNYCAMTLLDQYVFVTDAENKNICQYRKDGSFVKFLDSPMDFVVHDYAFDINQWNDTLYCVNPGRQLVEKYTSEGVFIAAFGGPVGKSGFFGGCSNPAFISFTPEGLLITSEKGSPRVSTFERQGSLVEVLLNSRMLGGGHRASQIKILGDNLFAAKEKIMTVFQHK